MPAEYDSPSYVRNEVVPDRRLTHEERLLWSEFETEFAPLVLSDRFGDDEELPAPNINECAWVSLYALSVLVLLRMREKLPLEFRPPAQPNIPHSMVTDFWRQRRHQLSAFASFLHSWGLGVLFGVPDERYPVDFHPQWATEHRVLGYHSFSTPQAVEPYVLRWKENAEIAASEMLYHRLVASRGIDLICSELISNGFEHASDGSTRPLVFIMSKLCTPQSCWVALQLDHARGHLSASERSCFEMAVAGNYSVLQLVIADTGHGFIGNKALERLYYQRGINRQATEADLIKFALLPEVSTKIFSETAAAEWERYLGDVTLVQPVIHGLSEVLLYVKEMRGCWRIHSNDSIVEYDFGSGVGRGRVNNQGRNVFGCLHYVMLPLPRSQPPIAVRHLSPIDRTKFTLIDIADDILGDLPKPLPELSESDWRTGILNVCRSILSTSSIEEPPPILLNLSLMDEAPSSVQQSLFALLADTLHRVRSKAAVLICGASEPTRSFLIRYQGMQAFFFDRRVLPFVALHESGAAEIEVHVKCGEALDPIKEDLGFALSPLLNTDIFRSDHESTWHLFEEVVHHNEGLFGIFRVGESDFRFEGRIKVAPEDTRTGRLLLGGRSSREFISKLRQHRALVRGSFLRLGANFDTYVHMGHLWADQEYMSEIVAWLAVAVQSVMKGRPSAVGRGSSSRNGGPADLDIVAVLHPAIDLAHSLAAHPVLREASITEIRRLGDIRWDFEPLLQLSGRPNIVCLVDMLYEGATANRLLDQLAYLGAPPKAIAAILNFGTYTPSRDVAVVAFSECTKQDIEMVSVSDTNEQSNS